MSDLPRMAYERRPTLPGGRQDALTGPTPPPTASEEFLRLRVPTGESMFREIVREELAAQEHRLSVRWAKHSGPQVSAEMTMWQTRARWRGGLAVAFGTALGIATTVFMSAWTAVDRYRTQATREATEAAASAVAPSITPVVAPLATRLDIAEDRLDALDARLQRVEDGISRMLELLQPPRGR